MPLSIEIENIDAIRREQGIEDIELRLEIRNLRAGDIVRLTFVSGPRPLETVSVRITQIRGTAFRGKLVKKTSTLPVGQLIVFSAVHIHSVQERKDASA